MGTTTARAAVAYGAPAAPPSPPASVPPAPPGRSTGGSASNGYRDPGAPAEGQLSESFRLVEGESVAFSGTFTARIILKHLKTTVVITNRRVFVHNPHTILGIVPHGYIEQSAPVEAISEAIASDHLSTTRLVRGAGCGLFGILLLSGNVLPGSSSLATISGLALLTAAVWLFMTARHTLLGFRHIGGGLLKAEARNDYEIYVAKHEINALLFGDYGVRPLPVTQR